MLDVKQFLGELRAQNPKSFYFFTGPEYGVKCEYLSLLKEMYGGRIIEYNSLLELLSTFSTKSLFGDIKSLYVVRYDKEAISKINSIKFPKSIPGTVVLLYDSDKDEAKIDKYYPENVLRVNTLSDQVMLKHLQSAYPELGSSVLRCVIKLSQQDFYKAKLICYAIMNMRPGTTLNQSEIEYIFGYKQLSSNERFKEAVVSRNFKEAIQEVDKCDSNIQNMLYDILSAMLDILKLLECPNASSSLHKYLSLWDFKSAVNYFNVVFDQIDKLRNFSSYSEYVSLIYVCSLLKYKMG